MTTAGSEKKHEIYMSKLLENVPNKFMLCVAASRRARQIKDNIHNAGILEEIPTIPVLEALKEIMDGDLLVSLRPEREEQIAQSSEEAPSTLSEKIAASGDSPKEEKKNKDSKSRSKSKSLAA